MRYLFVILLFAATQQITAQKIYGTVFNSQGDLLPYASITIKGTSQGASANDKAKFSFSLEPGTYTVICQRIGYTAMEKKVVLKEDTEISFVLTEQKLTMQDVTVRSGGEDPAYEIIRNAIKKRHYYQKQVDAFTCNMYSKDIIRIRELPKRIFGQKISDDERPAAGTDSSGKGIVYLSESVSKIYTRQPDKFKMEVVSSRVSGSGSFGFTFPTFISLYSNNVTVFSTAFNPRGFVSPIADGATGFYKYRFLGNFWEDGKAVNVIRVTPRRSYEPLFSGIINITDNDWRIHSFDLYLTKKSQLEIMDSLQLTQLHVPVSGDTWRVKNQLIHFNFKQFGIDAAGNFLTVYSDYNIAPTYDKKFFDRVVIKYDTAVNKRPRAYWDSIRPVPLEKEEQKDYAVKDSIYKNNRDSALSKFSIDSLNKRQGNIGVVDVFWKGIDRRHYSKKGTTHYGIDPLLKGLEYNFAEGLVVTLDPFYERFSKKLKSNMMVEPHFRYGFSNMHFNAWADVTLRAREWERDQKLKQHTLTFSGGKRVRNFFKESTLPVLSNSLSSLLWGNNFAKTYENYFGSIGFGKRYESGLRFTVSALYEDRLPLNNTTSFTISKKDSVNITPNYPVEKIPAQFKRYQATIVNFDISFKPGQKYIQFPHSKMSLGSKYPTFTLHLSKGLNNVLGSDVDFDQWRLSIADDKNLKLFGTLKYKMGAGGFPNRKQLYIQDYQHFNAAYARSDFNKAADYVNSFQLARYYGNSTHASFYSFAFLEHHLNGLLTNKIPLFKRLKWNMVLGGNLLYAREDNKYAEAFVGLENIFKIFRLDYIIAYRENMKPMMGVRIGGGGLLGGALNNSTGGKGVRGGGMTISF